MLDIDKMWDVLHFVLTGVSADHRIDDNPLSQAVLGVTSIEDLSDYMAYTEHSQIADIVAALEQFDMDQALESFDMTACKEAELYPNIWDYDEEEEEIQIPRRRPEAAETCRPAAKRREAVRTENVPERTDTPERPVRKNVADMEKDLSKNLAKEAAKAAPKAAPAEKRNEDDDDFEFIDLDL